jgi:Immunoglobulin I-set domain
VIMARFIGACAVLLFATVAWATPRETVTFSNVPSDGILGDPANAVRTGNFAGGYALGRVDFSGTLTSQQSRTWRTDSRVLVTAPGGQTGTIQPFTSGGTFTSLSFSGSVFMPAGTGFGAWTFRFYESVDDGGPGTVDATMTLTLTLTDEPPAPPASIDLGVLTTPGATANPLAVPTVGYRWYHFRLNRAVRADLARYLDIDTANSSMPPAGTLLQDDTQFIVFDSAGAPIASDDDSCQGLMSQFSFGAGTRPATGDGMPYAGQNGDLPAGDYYLAVGPYRLSATGGLWGVTSATGSRSGTIGLRVFTNLAAGIDCVAPAVTQQPADVVAPPDSTVHFTTAATGTAPVTYRWRHNNVDLADGGSISGAGTPTLTIVGVAPSDAGVYTAFISNPCGSVTTSAAVLSVICSADFDGDGDIGTDSDIEAFFACLGGNCCATCGSPDFNGDGDIGTDADIESFFRVLAGAAC